MRISAADQRVYVTNTRLPVFDFNTEQSRIILTDICVGIGHTNEILTDLDSKIPQLTISGDRLLVDQGPLTITNTGFETHDASLNSKIPQLTLSGDRLLVDVGSIAFPTILETHDSSLNSKIPQITLSGDAIKTFITNDIQITVPHLNYALDSVTVSGYITDISTNATLTKLVTDISNGVLTKGQDDTGVQYPLYVDANGTQRTQIVQQHIETAKYVFEQDVLTIASGTNWSLDARGRPGWYFNGSTSTLKWYGNNGISVPPSLQFNKAQALWFVATMDDCTSVPSMQVITSASTWEYTIPTPTTSIYNGEEYLFYYGTKAINLNPSNHPIQLTRTLVSGPGGSTETVTEINIVAGTSQRFLLKLTGLWNQDLMQEFQTVFENIRDVTAESNLINMTYDASALLTKVTNVVQTHDTSLNYNLGRLQVIDISSNINLTDINGILQTGITIFGKADDIYTGYQVPFLCDASGIQKTYVTNFPTNQTVTVSGTPTVAVTSIPAVTISGTSVVSITGTPSVAVTSMPVTTVSGTLKSQTYDWQNNGITSTNHTVTKYGLDTATTLYTSDMITRYALTSTADSSATKRGLDVNVINSALNIRDTSGTSLTSTLNALNTYPQNTAYTTATASRLADASGFLRTVNAALTVNDEEANLTLNDIKTLTVQQTTILPISTYLNQVESYQSTYPIPSVVAYPSSKHHTMSSISPATYTGLLLTGSNSSSGVRYTLLTFTPTAVGVAQSLYIDATAGVTSTVRVHGITLTGSEIVFYVICNGTTPVTSGSSYPGGSLDVNMTTDLRFINKLVTHTELPSGTVYARGTVNSILCTFVELNVFFMYNPMYMCPLNNIAVFKGLTHTAATASDNYGTIVYRWNNQSSTYSLEIPWRYTIATSTPTNLYYYSDGLITLYPNDILVQSRESTNGATVQLRGLIEVHAVI